VVDAPDPGSGSNILGGIAAGGSPIWAAGLYDQGGRNLPLTEAHTQPCEQHPANEALEVVSAGTGLFGGLRQVECLSVLAVSYTVKAAKELPDRVPAF
jgi:hypothetical protein